MVLRWQGSFKAVAVDLAVTLKRGIRVVLYLLDDAKKYAGKWTVEKILRDQSGHVGVPIKLVKRPGAEAVQVTDGAALWPNVHFRAESRHEYTVLASVPVAPLPVSSMLSRSESQNALAELVLGGDHGEAATNRTRDEFLPKAALDPGTVGGSPELMADNVHFKFLSAPLLEEQLGQIIPIGRRAQ